MNAQSAASATQTDASHDCLPPRARQSDVVASFTNTDYILSVSTTSMVSLLDLATLS
jgi:hypothetical protein